MESCYVCKSDGNTTDKLCRCAVECAPQLSVVIGSIVGHLGAFDSCDHNTCDKAFHVDKKKKETMDTKRKEKLKALTPAMRMAYRLLRNAAQELLDGECSEEEVSDALSRIAPSSHGYKREEDYATIDEGLRILGMGQNRVGFCNLMKRYGIVNEKFNSVHIGYNKQKILAVKHKQEELYQKRLAAIRERKRKERQYCDSEENFDEKW